MKESTGDNTAPSTGDDAASGKAGEETGFPRMPRLVASDLDGTLLGPGGRVSDRTARAVGAVRRAGVPVVLASGRPPRWMRPVAEAVGLTGDAGHEHAGGGLAICSNGAVLYDVGTGRVWRESPLDPALGSWLVEVIGNALPSTAFGVELGEVFRCEAAYRWDGNDTPASVRVVTRSGLFDRPAYKLLVQDRSCGADALLTKVRGLIGDAAAITHSGGDGLLEIAPPGVSKAGTLTTFCAEQGIEPADVVAFGDMPNDLEMLAWVGTSYAMANAHPDVRALADHTCGPNDRDGVAEVLESLFSPPRTAAK